MIEVVERPRRATRGSKRPSKAVKRKKRTKMDLTRQWLTPPPSYLRYSNVLRGIYWYWLSRDVREKEWIKWNKLCITCLEPIENWEDGDCGHILSSASCGEYLRFNRKNLTIQHKKCNNPRFSPNADALNAVHYDERYGQGAWQELYDLRGVECKEPKTSEYPALIEALDSYQRERKWRE